MQRLTQSTSNVAKISGFPPNPLAMFKGLLARLTPGTITMNLATVDSEFGVLNRTVLYRGLVEDSWISFVTERHSRKYHYLKKNPKVAVTMLFPIEDHSSGDVVQETWQVRLFDAEAIELDEATIAKLWSEESLFSKIRSHICECGMPVDHDELEATHNRLLAEFENGTNKLEQTKSYTAFKIIPKRWDFYKSIADHIGDRVQYRKLDDSADEWEAFHVAS